MMMMEGDNKYKTLFNTGRIYGLHAARVALSDMRQRSNLLSFKMVDDMLLRLIENKKDEE
jgi:hypothetical protein